VKRTAESETHVAPLKRRKNGRPKCTHGKFGGETGETLWTETCGVQLTQKDKASVESGDWLNDHVVNAAQRIVSAEFPLVEGLKDTVLLANGLYDTPLAGEGMQVHHLGNHWVLSSSIGGDVKVYDSLNTNMSTALRHQLVQVYRQHATGLDGAINIITACVQQQRGTNDCGLFSIANMFSLALGIDPSTVIFHQSSMRDNLAQCLVNEEVAMFPHSLSVGTRPIPVRIGHVSKFCTCHRVLPDHLIQCTECQMRFHFKCLKLTGPDILAMVDEEYKCAACRPS